MTTPLHLSCYKGSFELVSYLLTLEPEIDYLDGLGRTPLHLSCEGSDLKAGQEIIKLLINETECSINPIDNLGRTPLHYAAEKGRMEGCRILVENGAVLTLPDGVGQMTPSEIAGDRGFNGESVFFVLF